MDYQQCYEEFPFAIEFYDYVPYHLSLSDIDFFLDYARQTGGRVLELGSGTGRVLIPLARNGIEITGLDVSGRMLKACRKKLNQLPEEMQSRVDLVEASMHDFELGRKYGMIFSAFRSFQILTSTEHQLSCLTAAHRHLKENGLLILGLFDPYLPFLTDDSRKEEFGDDAPFDLPDGRTIRMKNRNPEVDQARQLLRCEIIYYVTYPDGREERLVQTFQLRYFFRYEMEHLLARTGFVLEELYGAYDRTEFGTSQRQEMILVARKGGRGQASANGPG